jgi:transposase
LRLAKLKSLVVGSVFLDLARQLREQGRTVQIVMEPTGSYSTPLLHAAHAADFAVFLVNPKRAHDVAEVYDGVPSKHDPKDAAVLAWLHAQGRSKRWTPLPESRRALRALLDERDLYAIPLEEHVGRAEARLAEWWPELLQVVAVVAVMRKLVRAVARRARERVRRDEAVRRASVERAMHRRAFEGQADRDS